MANEMRPGTFVTVPTGVVYQPPRDVGRDFVRETVRACAVVGLALPQTFELNVDGIDYSIRLEARPKSA